MDVRPHITNLEVTEYEWSMADVGLDPTGAIPTYRPGDHFMRCGAALQIHTGIGLTGEFAGWSPVEGMTLGSFLHALLGRNALERDGIYTT